jgi:hypothetical protein
LFQNLKVDVKGKKLRKKTVMAQSVPEG